jgi:hypothetical protein
MTCRRCPYTHLRTISSGNNGQNSDSWVLLRQKSMCLGHKKIILVFFRIQGVIYISHVSKGTRTNLTYIRTVLGRFVKILKINRPDTAAADCFPVRTTILSSPPPLCRTNCRQITSRPHSPVMVPVDYFLFPRVKVGLGAIYKMQEAFPKSWDGVLRTIAKEDFMAASRRWKKRCKKCFRIGDGYVKK